MLADVREGPFEGGDETAGHLSSRVIEEKVNRLVNVPCGPCARNNGLRPHPC